MRCVGPPRSRTPFLSVARHPLANRLRPNGAFQILDHKLFGGDTNACVPLRDMVASYHEAALGRSTDDRGLRHIEVLRDRIVVSDQ